jgi:hypothetical protein
VLRHMLISCVVAAMMFILSCSGFGSETPESSAHILAESFSVEEVQKVVGETHAIVKQQRESIMRSTISKDSVWPSGDLESWGQTLWCLSALYLNERVDEANRRLFEGAKAQTNFDPMAGDEQGSPWSYFGITDYVRILALFNSNSEHYPGRLRAETEQAMKQALWNWARDQWNWREINALIRDRREDLIWMVWGTENHDIVRKTSLYIVASIFKDDPTYRTKKYDDGYTAQEHYDYWNSYFKEWLKERATYGLWIEIGSSTYQKYSYSGIFNLYDLSPDPEVRNLTKMFLDISFIEEEQIAWNGVRGGGKSRADYQSSFEPYKNLLYGEGGGGTHSRVFETSEYMVPDEAIILRKLESPKEPFLISNRVPGELQERSGDYVYFKPDSALINYAYKTPNYTLGSTLQDPRIRYAKISSQKRWSGMLLHNPGVDLVSAVYPFPEEKGNRPEYAYWNFQYKNIMILQKMPMAYATGDMRVQFTVGLATIERDGWVFAHNETFMGNAYVAVRPAYDGYTWNSRKDMIILRNQWAPIIFHAGDVDEFGSFDNFVEQVLAGDLNADSRGNKFEYKGPNQPKITFYTNYKLPDVDGKSIDLRPLHCYTSPYMNSEWGSNKIIVQVGPYNTIYDFDNVTITTQGGNEK